ncbi:pentatricopeptide repeat protein [Moelleriella libera RCEF 2490]|uniref:Pentatricopeptide repeat protein n=1 Tax=Moelleriella libera RCEF 2490 TaxID=1081109 RepID=A0A168APZ2_9HYPO|nr:pentatricopeptide repeat protein [Moelleriella libera RCEF 2490]
MRGSLLLVYDGLWRCLCPAYDSQALRRAVTASTRRLQARSAARRPAMISGGARVVESRLLSTTTLPVPSSSTHAATTTRRRRTEFDGPPKPRLPIRSKSPRRGREQCLLMPSPPTEETLAQASVEDIVAALDTIRDARGWTFLGQDIDKHGRIMQLIEHLVCRRDQQPLSPFIYECLMDAMADPQGSVTAIRKLLDDMAAHNVKPTEQICQSALVALTNHPDYALRQEVLDMMKDYWFHVDARAQQNGVLGLLRDEQYELAHLRLTKLLEEYPLVDHWVLDVFIVVFGQLGFLDEMLQLLYWRESTTAAGGGGGGKDKDRGKDMSGLVYYALDVCSQAFHHPGTMFAWNRAVRGGGGLKAVSDGTAGNVLATAARHGDATLATEALDVLSRQTRVRGHDYEAVVEAFAKGGDVAGAMGILGIMGENGLRLCGGGGGGGQHVSAATMQVLMVYSDHVETTRALARDYMERHHGHGAVDDDDDDDDDAGSASLVVDPGLLISACAGAGELDAAFHFVEQAMSRRRHRRRRDNDGDDDDDDENDVEGLADGEWIRVLVAKAVEREDARLWGVVDEMMAADDEQSAAVGRVLRQMRITRRADVLRDVAQDGR